MGILGVLPVFATRDHHAGLLHGERFGGRPTPRRGRGHPPQDAHEGRAPVLRRAWTPHSHLLQAPRLRSRAAAPTTWQTPVQHRRALVHEPCDTTCMHACHVRCAHLMSWLGCCRDVLCQGVLSPAGSSASPRTSKRVYASPSAQARSRAHHLQQITSGRARIAGQPSTGAQLAPVLSMKSQRSMPSAHLWAMWHVKETGPANADCGSALPRRHGTLGEVLEPQLTAARHAG